MRLAMISLFLFSLSSYASEVYRVGTENVSPPIFTKKVAPVYPDDAIDAALQGYVILEAVFNKDGNVDQIVLLRDLGRGRYSFGESAIHAVQQWEYKPGKFNGEAADVRMTIKIDFILDANGTVLDVLSWKSENAESKAPKLYMDRSFASSLRDKNKLEVPLSINFDAQGNILGYVIDAEVLDNVAYPDVLRNNVDIMLYNVVVSPSEGSTAKAAGSLTTVFKVPLSELDN